MLEILKNQFELVARISISSEAVLILLQRTRLIAALTLAGQLELTKQKMGPSIVYLASLLAYKHREVGLTKDNLLNLARMGQKVIGLESSVVHSDIALSDACWIYAYILGGADDTLINQICDTKTISDLVRLMTASD